MWHASFISIRQSRARLATEADQDRAVNDANEITGLTQRTGGWAEPATDARGNMTTVPLPLSSF